MAHSFPSHFKNSTQQSHKNSHSFTSIFLDWNSLTSGIGSYDEPSPGSSSGSSNSNQRSPSTPTFPNYQTPTCNGFMSNTSVNGLYLNAPEDWMIWDEQNDPTLSSSPTRISSTTINTPPEIYFKTETALPSAPETVGFEVINRSSFNQGEDMTENSFMTNSVYCNGSRNFLHLPSQHILADLPYLEDQGNVCSFPISYSSETCLNLVEANSLYPNDTGNLGNAQESVQLDVLRGVSTSNFTLSSQCRKLQEYPGNRQHEGIPMTQAEKCSLLATERSDSNYNINSGLVASSSSPPQLHLGISPLKHANFHSPIKKRKFDYAYDDKVDPYSGSNDLNPNKSSNTGKNTCYEDVHPSGIIRPPKKTAHNMIEKRYRTNLNEKIAALRDAVPSLRIVVKCGNGLLRQSSKTHRAKKDEQKKPKLIRTARKETSDSLDMERDDLQGLTAANKLNKATILAKATEYIAHLEHRNRTLLEEREALRCQITALEHQNPPLNTGELRRTRVRDRWNNDLGADLDEI